MYFNFKKEQLDAILGTTSWSGDKLQVSNGKEIIVWRKANGGSKGDAHGRWAVNPKANQFRVGQKVIFSDCTAAKICTLTSRHWMRFWEGVIGIMKSWRLAMAKRLEY